MSIIPRRHPVKYKKGSTAERILPVGSKRGVIRNTYNTPTI